MSIQGNVNQIISLAGLIAVSANKNAVKKLDKTSKYQTPSAAPDETPSAAAPDETPSAAPDETPSAPAPDQTPSAPAPDETPSAPAPDQTPSAAPEKANKEKKPRNKSKAQEAREAAFFALQEAQAERRAYRDALTSRLDTMI